MNVGMLWHVSWRNKKSVKQWKNVKMCSKCLMQGKNVAMKISRCTSVNWNAWCIIPVLCMNLYNNMQLDGVGNDAGPCGVLLGWHMACKPTWWLIGIFILSSSTIFSKFIYFIQKILKNPKKILKIYIFSQYKMNNYST